MSELATWALVAVSLLGLFGGMGAWVLGLQARLGKMVTRDEFDRALERTRHEVEKRILAAQGALDLQFARMESALKAQSDNTQRRLDRLVDRIGHVDQAVAVLLDRAGKYRMHAPESGAGDDTGRFPTGG